MAFSKILIASTLMVGTALTPVLSDTSWACSRLVHTSKKGDQVVTARSMDWFEDIKTNLWAFPAGLKRDGAVDKGSATWTSKYGSVIASGFDSGTADGLNTAGLVANMLYLAEADFGPRDPKRPGVSWSIFTQYLLDNFATVAEAVADVQKKNIQVVASPLPGSVQKPPSLHFSISDATGDSAILQWINGKLVVYHNPAYTVMTNSPTFDKQLALNGYWDSVGGDAMLPGTRRAADRFVRASYYLKQLPDPKTTQQAMANAMSVIRNVSVPFGEADPQNPNVSTTIWRTAADQKQRVYYFESTLSPNLIWVSLDKLNLKSGGPVQKLSLADDPADGFLTGEMSGHFKPTPPFVFTGP
jgi:choloylglycine hydrolase